MTNGRIMLQNYFEYIVITNIFNEIDYDYTLINTKT